MPAATQQLDSNREYIFIDGRYYRKDEISSDLVAKLRQREAGLIILDDVFLNNLIAHCKKKKVDLSEVPLKIILRFKYGTGNFNPGYFDERTQYDFNPDNGIVYDSAYYTYNTDKKPYEKINIYNSIPHPFANQLAAAVRYAKSNNKKSIDLNQVLQAASKNTENKTYCLPKPKNMKSYRPDYVLLCGIIVMVMIIPLVAFLVQMAWLAIAVIAVSLVFYTGSIVYNYFKTNKIAKYFNANKLALAELGVKPTQQYHAILDFLFNLALSIPLGIVSGSAYLLLISFSLTMSRIDATSSPLKSIYNLMRSKENPLEVKDKVKVGLVAATGVGLIGGVIASSYLLPVLGIGLLSAALGPAGVGVIAAVIFLVVARFVLNYYAEKRLNKLHPKVVEIHAEKQAQRSAARLGFREINEIIPDADLDNAHSNDAINDQSAKRDSHDFNAKTKTVDGKTTTLYGNLILQLRNSNSNTTSSSFTSSQNNANVNNNHNDMAVTTSGQRNSIKAVV